MPQLTAPRPTRSRTHRTERMVVLRSAMPVQLVTLRHERPVHILHDLPLPTLDEREQELTITTSQVRDTPETPAEKGGDAR